MSPSLSPLLVVLSLLVATLASYTALDLAGRVTAARGRVRQAWLLAGAVALGGGIWSMHFLGMLAFRLPVPVRYDPALLLLSALIPVAAASVGLSVAVRPLVRRAALIGGGIFLGAAITGMHYTGMRAMRMAMHLRYDPLLVAASVAIAVCASVVALWVASRHGASERAEAYRARLASGLLLGSAIAGMHYTGMAAARFSHGRASADALHTGVLATDGLAVAVLLATLGVLGLALTGAMLDRRVARRLAWAEAIRESEERFRELAANIRGVFWLRSLDTGGIEYVSPGYQEIFGRDPETLLRDPNSFVEAIHPEDRERVAASRRSQAHGEHQLEYRIVRPDGSVRWVSARVYPIRSPQGLPHRVAGLAEDVTERKELEAQLLHARKMEAVGRLAGGVAHDLNNVLTTVNGLVALLRDPGVAGPQRALYLDEIDRAAGRSAALVRQLLAFGRKQVLQPRVLDLNLLLAGLEPMLRRTIGMHAEIDFVYAPAPTYVRIDPGQLEQVLVNLVINARDAMPSGGRIALRTFETGTVPAGGPGSEDLPPGSYVGLSVTDIGTGIEPHLLERIFEPFFTTKPQGQGTGLGLATAYGVVEQSGGRLHVRSEPGAGSTFTVYLPGVAPEGEAPAPTGPAVGAAPRRSASVLVVDDEPMILLMVGIFLRRLGYTVLEASSGAAALEAAARSGAVDLLLTDVMMPEMNGREIAERLAPRHPEMRVLFMSGHTEDEIVRKGVLDADFAFIPKPFQMEDLVERIAGMLGEAECASCGGSGN